MTSRWTYHWSDEKAGWELSASDLKVTDKFNQWAAQNNVNPVSHSIVPTHQVTNRGKTMTVIHTLSASVVDRVQQAQMELAYREQIARLVASLTPPVAIPPAAIAPQNPEPSPDAALPPDVNMPAGAVPMDDPLNPVDVNQMGEMPPRPPGT